MKGVDCDGLGAPEEFHESEVPGVYGLSIGDVIPIGTLLKLAGVDLDLDMNAAGETSRYTGIAIQIDVAYVNRKSFQLDFWRPGELHYVYRVTSLPVETYKATGSHVLVNGHRVLSDMHGIFIYVAIQGDVAYFDSTELQLLLATFVSLVSIANLALNFYAEHIWHHKEAYNRSKYDRTVSLNHEDPICCCLGCAEDPNEDTKVAAYRDAHEAFVDDLVALDGNALRWAGVVLHKTHETLHSDHQEDIQRRVSMKSARSVSSEIDLMAYIPVDRAGERIDSRAS
jgi:hypothetical protein